ncbi:MAG TPA: S-layer protein [Candidatus Nanoarchaeia archaeon]|nr:S-layer protein [Candidatus Nanoarchaeia archaeon]
MFVIDKQKNEVYSLPAKEIKPDDAASVSSGLASKILHLIAKEPMYAIDIAKSLKMHEQKIYYHIRNLEKAGIIRVVKKETKQGATANFYGLTEPAFVIRFKNFETTSKIGQIKNESVFLEPFISNGQLDSLIIVGSPDPHGPDKARSRDGYYGMDLALFLGTFLNYVPQFNVKLDTEVRDEDLQNNLILIGGPVVNKIVDKVNAKLPIRFEEGNIRSTVSNETYPQDECGIIVKAKNPFNPDKSILVVAGKRFSGTRAAIIAFLKGFKKITDGNVHNPSVKAKVVEGIDLDSDGIIDDIEFRE